MLICYWWLKQELEVEYVNQYRYTKPNNKYMKNYDKKIESSYLTYLDANNLHGWAMSQKLPVNGFMWENDLSEFNEDFIKN